MPIGVTEILFHRTRVGEHEIGDVSIRLDFLRAKQPPVGLPRVADRRRQLVAQDVAHHAADDFACDPDAIRRHRNASQTTIENADPELLELQNFRRKVAVDIGHGDRLGSVGYSGGDYTGSFGGTSSASLSGATDVGFPASR